MVEARARRIAAQTRFHAVMEPNMAVGIYTGPEKEGWELSLVLANARRAAKLSGQAGDQRGRISAQILLARVVWASLGHADVEVGPTPASGTVSGSASAPPRRARRPAPPGTTGSPPPRRSAACWRPAARRPGRTACPAWWRRRRCGRSGSSRRAPVCTRRAGR
ncbi:hypothetical protein ACFQXA_07005 [Nocardiopsis composta]